jgi:hypothetical protein
MSLPQDNAGAAMQPPVLSANLPSVSPPAALSSVGDVGANWGTFKQMWGNYSIITELNRKPNEYQCAMFLHSVGEYGLKIYNGLQFGQGENNKSLEEIFNKFDTFTIGERNETYEQYVFNNRLQESGENIDSYVSILTTLAKTCKVSETPALVVNYYRLETLP